MSCQEGVNTVVLQQQTLKHESLSGVNQIMRCWLRYHCSYDEPVDQSFCLSKLHKVIERHK